MADINIIEENTLVDVTEENINLKIDEEEVSVVVNEDDVNIIIEENEININFLNEDINLNIIEEEVNVSISEGVLNLVELQDVNISDLENNQLLKYNESTNKWVNASSVDTNPTRFDDFTITATEIANKYVTLSNMPTNNQSIRVFVDNIGIKAEQGVDYSISGNQIFWTGYNFNSLLSLDDKLKIVYV